jgi:hypothetical protein
MRKSSIAGVWLALLVYLPPNVKAADGVWTPDAKSITRLESLIKIPRGHPMEQPVPLKRYWRYYAGVTEAGKPMIKGALIALPIASGGTPPGIHVGPESDLPAVLDGGCRNVRLLYDPKSDRIVRIECGGLG